MRIYNHFAAASIRRLIVIGTGPVLIAGCPPPAPEPAGHTVALVSVAEGLTSPVTMAVPSDGSDRKFIVDQIGIVRILDRNGTMNDSVFVDIRSRMIELNPTYDERGLLGMAFHPQYATNRRFFLMYNARPGPDVPAGFTNELHISEFTASQTDPNLADVDSERVLLRIPKPQANHNGGTIEFGPDGYLYVSVGDGGGANDTAFGHTPIIGNGQDISQLLGKILRIDVDAAAPYAVPTDNPFVGVPGAAPETWALGFRNPYRISFDRQGERRLFAADAGQSLFEEVSIVTRGGNYGWFIREAESCFNPADATSPLASCSDVGPSGVPLTDPIVAYPHSGSGSTIVGSAVVGGYVYRGSGMPALNGQYVFGDFSTASPLPEGAIFAARESADASWDLTELFVAGTANGRIGRFILGFGQDAEGELYVLTSLNLGPAGNTGVVYRIQPPG